MTVPELPRATKNVGPQGQLAETVQLLKDYARQETVGPLKGAGRWIALGIVGAISIGLSTAFLVLGLLRLVQTEWPGTFEGRWARLAPYLFGLVFCGLVLVLAVARINKQPLTKEKR
jgi:hypothetical protein